MMLENSASGEDALRGWLVAAFAADKALIGLSELDVLVAAHRKMEKVIPCFLSEVKARGWHTDQFLDGNGSSFVTDTLNCEVDDLNGIKSSSRLLAMANSGTTYRYPLYRTLTPIRLPLLNIARSPDLYNLTTLRFAGAAFLRSDLIPI
ncbi:hypothetical protein HPP92_011038 [Vanilla planifolia]|uniref:Uncharacterized protein n=1 Tax=Vanilla planifolia TaxID=51239 RepID=A0A835R6A4_VANPL|nr:hypothetical protein HPP92_011038 [Vanilla planifolia]